jgi:hypothetical protein
VTSTGTPWRQIFSVKKIEFCGALKYGSTFFVLQSLLAHWKELIPAMLTECPLKVPYHFRAININYTEVEDDGTRWVKVPLANGVYRIQLRFTNDRDRDGVYIEWRSENRFVKNINVFNKK